jgi:uncharacterized protein YndB with AHSA1/START domain
MKTNANIPSSPGPLDLTLSRVIDAPPELVWRAWTDPEHLKKWWAPKPVELTVCDIDLRPGGRFRTVMRDPEGNEYPGDGAFLDVVECERIVFTDAVTEGYRPTPESFMTAIITLEPQTNGGTRYTAMVLHKDEADRAKHEEMGFFNGWKTCLDQLAALAESFKEAS